MANHVRKQLRDAVVTALTGLTTTGARVAGQRLYAIRQDTELPRLNVYVNDEQAENITVHAPALVERLPIVHVKGTATGASAIEDTLDQIAKEVEIALAANLTVATKTVQLRYTGCDFEFDLGDRPVGTIDMRFAVQLFNPADTPDSLA